MPAAEVSFNYLGQWDTLGQTGGLLSPSDRPTGGSQAPEEARHHLVDVNAIVMGGRLEVQWGYSARRHRRETVTRRAERYLDLLRAFGSSPTTTRGGTSR
jgi:non-ribosomal peptide synthase protein (TIGR01720 family)